MAPPLGHEREEPFLAAAEVGLDRPPRFLFSVLTAVLFVKRPAAPLDLVVALAIEAL
jgi:hypothetical protein